MAISVFSQENSPPEPAEVAARLGTAGPLWDRLVIFIQAHYDMVGDMVYGGKKYGWTLWYRQGGKSLVTLYPQENAFVAQVVLSKEQVEQALALDLGETAARLLRAAPQLPDGCWLFVQVAGPAEAAAVEQLLQVKHPVTRRKRSKELPFPRFEQRLPAVAAFAAALAEEIEVEQLASPSEIQERVMAFFSPDRIAGVDGLLPGWAEMIASDGGATLTHLMTALAVLPACPEYQEAAEEQQALAQWMILLHDIAKRPLAGQRDPIHAFRSAARAGRILAGLGFAVSPQAAPQALDAWEALVFNALLQQPGRWVQDNQKLEAILLETDRLFGPPAAWVVKAILLHVSISVLRDWPQEAPLSEAEILRYVDEDWLPLLKMMFLIDNDAYTLFDPPTKNLYRRETLAYFAHLATLSQ